MNIDLTILSDFKRVIIDSLPKIAGIILFIIAGGLILKFLLFVLKRFLKFSKIEVLNRKLDEVELLSSINLKVDFTKIILFFAKWIIILVIIIIGADIFELDKISGEVGKLIDFLPILFSAIIIFFMGIFLASYMQKTFKKLLESFDAGGSKSISTIVFYIILSITVIVSLNQLGINTQIITDNISIILGALLLPLSIALGLGSRDIVQRLLFGYYSRKNFEIGQRIRIDEKEGTIVSIDNICLILQVEDQKIVYPIKQIVNKPIEIL